METLLSTDGTPIAFTREGSGPSLVLVHGTNNDHSVWTPVLPALRKRFTVYAMDRRGRGRSGDGGAYAIEREFEDVATLVDAVPGPVLLVGHSFGAFCSLEAALLARNLGKLVLYEPPLVAVSEVTSPEIIGRIDELVRTQQRELALEVFLREVARTPESQLKLLRALPAWSAWSAVAHTLPREIRAVEGYALVGSRFSRLDIPVLLLLGGDSPPFFASVIDSLRQALPRSRVAVMPQQRHLAMITAPALFVRELLAHADSTWE
ncbi:alpha/beta fold hydrolase [Melittangium boletus]|uniref:alpha/beta fold hydrolase n=1 Tax=Melittangium boletus TaxID=83453 RepID=UPI000BB3D2E8|nr:alpha/beta fold hydrolase [Melittangium boletus]